MALIQPAQPAEPDGPEGPGAARRRRLARYGVPVAVAGIAAATICLVPALADAGDPSLPSVTAEQLLAKIAAAHPQALDGTVRVSTDLGLPPAFSGGAGSSLFGGAGPAGGQARDGSGSPAAPQARLPQLLVGTHQLHVSADGPDRQKLSVLEPAAEYSVIHNGTQLWAYDSASDQAYHATLPARDTGAGTGTGTDSARPPLTGDFPATPQAAAQQLIKAARGTASFTVDGTARVAGHSAYELVVTPQHADSTTVGSIRIAVDAGTGVPLEATLNPKGGGKAVFDIAFTKVGFGKPAASTFSFTPPKGVKVTEGGGTAAQQGRGGADGADGPGGADGRDSRDSHGAASGRPGDGTTAGPTVLGEGWDAIAVITLPRTDGPGKAGKAGRSGPDAKGEPGKDGGAEAQSLMNSFGTRVTGSFGSGTVFHTRLVNALLTDQGKLYVGAVTQSALTDAASAGK